MLGIQNWPNIIRKITPLVQVIRESESSHEELRAPSTGFQLNAALILARCEKDWSKIVAFEVSPITKNSVE